MESQRRAQGHHQDVHRAVANDPGGDIAHQVALQGGFAPAANNNQVGADFLGFRHDGGMRDRVLGHHRLDAHLELGGCRLDGLQIFLFCLPRV